MQLLFKKISKGYSLEDQISKTLKLTRKQIILRKYKTYKIKREFCAQIQFYVTLDQYSGLNSFWAFGQILASSPFLYLSQTKFEIHFFVPQAHLAPFLNSNKVIISEQAQAYNLKIKKQAFWSNFFNSLISFTLLRIINVYSKKVDLSLYYSLKIEGKGDLSPSLTQNGYTYNIKN